MKIIFSLTTFLATTLTLFSQCYEGSWATSTEIICLDAESQIFTYIHDSLFGEDDTLQGPYQLSGDTLVFQPGLSYDTLPILKISYLQTEDGAGNHYIDLLDHESKSIPEYIFYAGNYTYAKGQKHEPYIRGDLPVEIQLDYRSFVEGLVPNPISPQKQNIRFLPPPEEGPFEVKIQLDTRGGIKNIFEGESKAVITEKGLNLLKYNGESIGTWFKPKD